MAAILPAGVQAKYYAKIEGTFDTVADFVGADAVPLNTLEITPTREFHKSAERVGSASLQREIEGMSGGTWSATFYAKPNGTTVTLQPDAGAFLEAAFGNVNNSGDVTYRMHDGTNEVTTAKSLQIARAAGAGFYEVINGAWVEQCDFEITGNAETVISVSGGFASYGYSFGATLASQQTTNTDIVLATGHGSRIGVGAAIQFNDGGSVTNNTTGFRVTAVSGDTITVHAATGATLSASTTVEPFAPAQTLTTNSPIGGVGCGLSVGGVALGMISFKASIKTGIHGLSAEATTSKPNRLSMGEREVTGEISSYFLASATATEDISRIVGAAHSGTTYALIARAGADTTKARMKINVPAARLDVSPVSLPEAEEATVAMSFMARQGSANGDEISVDFD